MHAAICITIVIAGCSTGVAKGPVEGALVSGSLVQSQATISLDVLIPREGDLPAAIDRARDDAKSAGLILIDSLPTTTDKQVVKVSLVNIEDEQWSHRLPGYVASKIDRDEFPQVDASPGLVRIEANASPARAWELLRSVTTIARDLAASQHGWIYDSYRAQLHDADTFATSIPDGRTHDVRAMIRIMGVVSTHGELAHIRSIGLWRLGLPELYLPDVANSDLDAAMDLVRATAQTLVQNGSVGRGVIEVDLAKLPQNWPKPGSGTGRFTWQARWMRGPIHHNAMQIVLSTRGSREKAASAFSAALHRYTGTALH